MTRLTILRGISGSGKSTFARQQNAIVVSRDSIRHDTLGIPAEGYYEVSKEVLTDRENMITRLQDAMVAALLKAGKDVIVDNTNIEWSFVKSLAKIGYRYGAEVEVKVFDIPLDTAVMRDLNRKAMGGRSVGSVVISKQHQRFKSNKSMTLDPVQVAKPYTGTPGKPKAFMFDLDGTAYHMNGKRGPYAENVDVDDPDELIQELVNAISTVTGWTPIAMSGRKERTRFLTEGALYRDGVMFDHLFMRGNDDNRSDNLVKIDLFDEHVRDNFDVQFVFDDRDQVVEAWRRIGLKCLQVAEGAF